MYSFGVVLWECLTRKVPWKDEVAGVDMLLLAVTSGERPALPADAPLDLASMTRACWSHDPTVRPAFNGLLADLGSARNLEAGLLPVEEVAHGGTSVDGRAVQNGSLGEAQRREGEEGGAFDGTAANALIANGAGPPTPSPNGGGTSDGAKAPALVVLPRPNGAREHDAVITPPDEEEEQEELTVSTASHTTIGSGALSIAAVDLYIHCDSGRSCPTTTMFRTP